MIVTRFMYSSMARSLELKHMLESQSTAAYLREIKSLTNGLASIKYPVLQQDLVHCTLLGLG